MVADSQKSKVQMKNNEYRRNREKKLRNLTFQFQTMKLDS